jgi:hypothetical protein
MVRNGDSFQSQSSEEFNKVKNRKNTVSPSRIVENFQVARKNRTVKETFKNPFVVRHGQSLPRLNPVTPRRSTKSTFTLPNIKKHTSSFLQDFQELEKIKNLEEISINPEINLSPKPSKTPEPV